MDSIIDLIATDASPSEVSDAIKSVLFAKAAEKIDSAKPYVANSMFVETEIDQETEEEEQE
jgi:hypothetical protein